LAKFPAESVFTARSQEQELVTYLDVARAPFPPEEMARDDGQACWEVRDPPDPAKCTSLDAEFVALQRKPATGTEEVQFAFRIGEIVGGYAEAVLKGGYTCADVEIIWHRLLNAPKLLMVVLVGNADTRRRNAFARQQLVHNKMCRQTVFVRISQRCVRCISLRFMFFVVSLSDFEKKTCE
jgi:hypothetical protein